MISTFLLLYSDWYDLLTEDAALSRRQSSLVTLYRVLILVLARDLQVLCTHLCTDGLDSPCMQWFTAVSNLQLKLVIFLKFIYLFYLFILL